MQGLHLSNNLRSSNRYLTSYKSWPPGVVVYCFSMSKTRSQCMPIDRHAHRWDLTQLYYRYYLRSPAECSLLGSPNCTSYYELLVSYELLGSPNCWLVMDVSFSIPPPPAFYFLSLAPPPNHLPIYPPTLTWFLYPRLSPTRFSFLFKNL